MIKSIFFCLPFLISSYILAQGKGDTGKIIVDHSDFMSLRTSEGDQFQILTGHVAMHQDSMRLFCDSAIIKNEKYVTAHSNIVIQHGISLTIFADQLYYDAEKKVAKLQGNIIFINEGRTLFTQFMEYDANSKTAYFESSSQLVADSLSLRSNRGKYEVNTKIATFLDSVFVENPDFKMLTNNLKYNMDLEISEFSGPTVIELDSGYIYAEGGFFNQQTNESGFWINAKFERSEESATADTILYDQQKRISRLFGNGKIFQNNGSVVMGDYIENNEATKNVIIEGCSYVKDSTGILEATTIFFNQSEGWGSAKDDVFWQDSSSRYFIQCDSIYYLDSLGFFKALGSEDWRPLLISVSEEDSLFLSADTLLSTKELNSRHFSGYPNVKVFKTDLQMVCDSLHYQDQLSAFQLFRDPVIWSDTSSFYGDTIFVFLKENEIEKIRMINNSFIINSKDEYLFNQIKGKEMISFFKEGKINYVEVNGNAESVYFVTDDIDAYIGANKAVGSEMVIRFEDNEVQTIKIIKEVESKFIPIQEAELEELKMEGFKWMPLIRPQNVNDIRAIKKFPH